MPIITASADYLNHIEKPRRYVATFVCNWEFGRAHFFRVPNKTFSSYDEALRASRLLEADFVKLMKGWLGEKGYEEYDFSSSHEVGIEPVPSKIKNAPADIKKMFMSLDPKKRAALLKQVR